MSDKRGNSARMRAFLRLSLLNNSLECGSTKKIWLYLIKWFVLISTNPLFVFTPTQSPQFPPLPCLDGLQGFSHFLIDTVLLHTIIQVTTYLIIQECKYYL